MPTIPTGFLSVPQAPAPIAAGPSRPHPPAPAPAKAKARPAPGNDEPRVRAFIETTYNLVCSGVGCWWSDDGDSFVDETDDIVTNHPAGGYWYEGTFYLTSSGQGILAKVFEQEEE